MRPVQSEPRMAGDQQVLWQNSGRVRRISAAFQIQLAPALTDFKGPTIFICYRRISIIAEIENKENIFKGFPLLAGSLYRDSTVIGLGRY